MAPDSDASKKPVRASRGKTRNGCQTCKIRRVKCDEAKPTCNRCFNFGIKCDGYIKPTVLKSLPPVRIILPRGAEYFEPIVYQPRVTIFQDIREQQYFRIFRESIAPHLAGSFESDLWSCLVLQACERDDSIRHAIVAIAALKLTVNSTLNKTIGHHGESDAGSIHRDFALRQYQKAIKSMRLASIGGVQDLRTTLIACIVIICFEASAGNFEQALRQAVIGLNLVGEHLSDDDAASQQKVSVEKEIIDAFGRLDIHSMAFLDPRYPKRVGVKKIQKFTGPIFPLEFTSLIEARDSLISTMQRVLHFTSSMYPESLGYTGFLRQDFMMCIPLEHFDQKVKLIEELEDWRSAMSPLIESSLLPSGAKDRFGAACLEMMYLAGYITTSMLRTIDGGCPDSTKYMSQYEKIVALAEELLQHSNMNQHNSSYMFEMHTVCPLYAVSWYCPQKTLRRKAISLLLAPARVEALWDSAMVGKLAQWIMEMEEENYEGEYAPADVRCTRGDILGYNMVSRQAEVRCFVPSPDSTELVTRTSTLSF
ncbi:hypothetical protein VTL71DRAFT_16171 [Oculimacula yallundae]|uniref:Zn(2)-C6 fungal-type domain-containing protein n=1 Tax=Oculimacula yallundae TaxID=86028 RepID=A0ABR4CDR2_9HELO